ncbi:MAG: hypothetical protein CM15mP74_22610 [Halieaceae bacterium]|nr:MAG: hypothetical protein CM15mP74_22610 [Halieaceae bacterium]
MQFNFSSLPQLPGGVNNMTNYHKFIQLTRSGPLQGLQRTPLARAEFKISDSRSNCCRHCVAAARRKFKTLWGTQTIFTAFCWYPDNSIKNSPKPFSRKKH